MELIRMQKGTQAPQATSSATHSACDPRPILRTRHSATLAGTGLVQFAEFPHLLCLSIASSSSSSDRGEMPSTRNPGKLSEAVVSICISST
jgi:hypothetical protein